MSVLVDDAAWRWRGDRWAHLVSDTSADELHEFANAIGVRRLAFQDDHYDLPSARRDAAVARGATPVTSRVLVEALRRSGLRVRGRREPWSHGTLPFDAAESAALGPVYDRWADLADVTWTTVLRRAGLMGLSATFPAGDIDRPVVPAALRGVAFAVDRPEGWILDIVVRVAR
jgi:Protein of unknown function (DUF4031)